jgi:hypothetical protein
VKCGDKEWQHCRVEKMGCKGCYYDEIEPGEYVRFKDETIDKIVDIIETQGNQKLIAFEKRNSYKSETGLVNCMDKHGKKISDVLKEGDVIFYKINNSSIVYISKVKKHKNGLGANFYTLEQLNIMKVITEKELKQTGYDIKEVYFESI